MRYLASEIEFYLNLKSYTGDSVDFYIYKF